MRARDERTFADVLPTGKKLRKTLGIHPPVRLYKCLIISILPCRGVS